MKWFQRTLEMERVARERYMARWGCEESAKNNLWQRGGLILGRVSSGANEKDDCLTLPIVGVRMKTSLA